MNKIDLPGGATPAAAEDLIPYEPPHPRRQHVPKDTMDAWRAEEPELIAAWQEENNEQALQVLLERYESLFASQISRILAGRSVSREHRADLKQEAYVAFVRAVSSFDPNMGTRLATHATNHVRTSLLRYALDFRNGYRIGTTSDERKAFYAALATRANRIKAGKSDQLDDEDIARIARQTGAPLATARRAVSTIYTSQSGIDSAEHVTAEGMNPAQLEEDLSVDSAMDILMPMVENMEPRKQAIFAALLGKTSESTQDIADRFNVTRERIGQLRRELIGEFRVALEEAGLEADDVL